VLRLILNLIMFTQAIKKVPVVAVVYNPIMHELFYAVKGAGAFRNGQRIRVSDTASLNKASIVMEYGYDRTPQGNPVNNSALCGLRVMTGPHDTDLRCDVG